MSSDNKQDADYFVHNFFKLREKMNEIKAKQQRPLDTQAEYFKVLQDYAKHHQDEATEFHRQGDLKKAFGSTSLSLFSTLMRDQKNYDAIHNNPNIVSPIDIQPILNQAYAFYKGKNSNIDGSISKLLTKRLRLLKAIPLQDPSLGKTEYTDAYNQIDKNEKKDFQSNHDTDESEKLKEENDTDLRCEQVTEKIQEELRKNGTELKQLNQDLNGLIELKPRFYECNIFRHVGFYFIPYIAKLIGDPDETIIEEINKRYKKVLEPECLAANIQLLKIYLARYKTRHDQNYDEIKTPLFPNSKKLVEMDHRSIISHYEYALLSFWAYERHPHVVKNLKQRTLLLEDNLGWILLATSDELGIKNDMHYFGVAYYKPSANAIVIAHKGTNQFFDYIADAYYAVLDQMYIHFPAAVVFVKKLEANLKKLTAYIKEQHKNNNDEKINEKTVLTDLTNDLLRNYGFQSIADKSISKETFTQLILKLVKNQETTISMSHTGHSLGALLAEFTACCFDQVAVTFDSPGSKRILKYLAKIKGQSIKKDYHSLITTYFAEPNIINVTDEHVGTMLRIYPYKIATLGFLPPRERWQAIQKAFQIYMAIKLLQKALSFLTKHDGLNSSLLTTLLSLVGQRSISLEKWLILSLVTYPIEWLTKRISNSQYNNDLSFTITLLKSSLIFASFSLASFLGRDPILIKDTKFSAVLRKLILNTPLYFKKIDTAILSFFEALYQLIRACGQKTDQFFMGIQTVWDNIFESIRSAFEFIWRHKIKIGFLFTSIVSHFIFSSTPNRFLLYTMISVSLFLILSLPIIGLIDISFNSTKRLTSVILALVLAITVLIETIVTILKNIPIKINEIIWKIVPTFANYSSIFLNKWGIKLIAILPILRSPSLWNFIKTFITNQIARFREFGYHLPVQLIYIYNSLIYISQLSLVKSLKNLSAIPSLVLHSTTNQFLPWVLAGVAYTLIKNLYEFYLEINANKEVLIGKSHSLRRMLEILEFGYLTQFPLSMQRVQHWPRGGVPTSHFRTLSVQQQIIDFNQKNEFKEVDEKKYDLDDFDLDSKSLPSSTENRSPADQPPKTGIQYLDHFLKFIFNSEMTKNKEVIKNLYPLIRLLGIQYKASPVVVEQYFLYRIPDELSTELKTYQSQRPDAVIHESKENKTLIVTNYAVSSDELRTDIRRWQTQGIFRIRNNPIEQIFSGQSLVNSFPL